MGFDSRLVAGYTTCCSPLHGKSRTDFTRCGAAEGFVIGGSVESLEGGGGATVLQFGSQLCNCRRKSRQPSL